MGRPAEVMPRSEPSRGNPAARDRREACGNVSMMGAGLRPHGKPWDEPPYPKVQSAPHFYPDPRRREESREDTGSQRTPHRFAASQRARMSNGSCGKARRATIAARAARRDSSTPSNGPALVLVAE